MKTLKENTINFINEVKSVLDNANWDFEACNPSGNYSDTEKACSYLETQKFSYNKVKDALNEVWSDIIDNIKSEQIREGKAKFAATMIANQLGYERISKFQASQWGYRIDGLNSKKWYINETVTFKIN